MYANYEMDMPKRYVDLSEDEMEYSGGWGFSLTNVYKSVASAIVSIPSTCANVIMNLQNDPESTKKVIEGSVEILIGAGAMASGVGGAGVKVGTALGGAYGLVYGQDKFMEGLAGLQDGWIN